MVLKSNRSNNRPDSNRQSSIINDDSTAPIISGSSGSMAISTTSLSLSTKQITNISEFVRHFVRSHVAPNQRAQSDLQWRPNSKINSQNINIVPQSVRLCSSTNKNRWKKSIQRKITNRDQFGHCNKICKKQRVLFSNKKNPIFIHSSLVNQLHQLWLGYFNSLCLSPYRKLSQGQESSVIMSPPIANLMELVLRMNLIGANLKVLRSIACHMAGSQGIVVMETKNTFQMALGTMGINSQSLQIKLITIPKAGSLFLLIFQSTSTLNNPNTVIACTDNGSAISTTSHTTSANEEPKDLGILLNGDCLTYRASDRALRKWRRIQKPSIKLWPDSWSNEDQVADILNRVHGI